MDEKEVTPTIAYNRSTLIVDGRYGKYVVNAQSSHGRLIKMYGEHSQNELDFLSQFIKPSDFVIDVGAHQGSHTLFFARAVGKGGFVLAFEPQRIMCQYLSASLCLNNIKNVSLLPNAVGEVNGTTRLAEYDYSAVGSPSQMKMSEDNGGERVVQVTIDWILRELKIDRPISLIKIDVSGTEQSVLRGASATLTEKRPLIYLQYDKGNRGSAIAKQVLKSMGYRVFLHKVPGFNPHNFRAETKNLFGTGSDDNAVAIHVSQCDKHFTAISLLEEIK